MRLERLTNGYRRVVTDMGTVVGFASLCANGQWCALDYDGIRISRAGVFDNPRQALKWFKQEERV